MIFHFWGWKQNIIYKWLGESYGFIAVFFFFPQKICPTISHNWWESPSHGFCLQMPCPNQFKVAGVPRSLCPRTLNEISFFPRPVRKPVQGIQASPEHITGKRQDTVRPQGKKIKYQHCSSLHKCQLSSRLIAFVLCLVQKVHRALSSPWSHILG